jgi:hypothetical protein
MDQTASFVITLVISELYIVATMALIWKFRKEEVVRKRWPLLIIVMGCWNLVMNAGFLSGFAFWKDSVTSKIPCHIHLALLYFSIPMILFLLILRNTQYTISFYVAKANTEDDFELKWYEKYLFMFVRYLNRDRFQFERRLSDIRRRSSLVNRKLSVARSDAVKVKSKPPTVLKSVDLDRSTSKSLSPEFGGVELIRPLQVFLACVGIFALELVTFIVSLAFIDIQTETAGENCWRFGTLIGIYIITGCCAMFLFYISLLMRSVNDTISIRAESFVVTSSISLALVLFIITTYLPFSPFTDIKTHLSSWFLTEIFGSIIPILITCLYPIYLVYQTRKNIGQFDLDETSFVKVLTDPEKFILLKEEAKKSFSLENILFYETMRRFYARYGYTIKMGSLIIEDFDYINYDNVNKEVARRYENVYEEFIKPGSKNELNLSFQIRRDFEELMKRSALRMESMDPIMNEVLRIIYANTFPRFLLAEKVSSHRT